MALWKVPIKIYSVVKVRPLWYGLKLTNLLCEYLLSIQKSSFSKKPQCKLQRNKNKKEISSITKLVPWRALLHLHLTLQYRKNIILWIGTVHYGRDTRTAAQARVARVESLIEEIGEFEYQDSFRKRLAYLRDERPRWEVRRGESRIEDGTLEAKDNKGYSKES